MEVDKDAKVEVCMPYGPSDNPISMPIATLDLSRLGKEFKKNREKIKHVYVVGGNRMSSIEENTEGDQQRKSIS